MKLFIYDHCPYCVRARIPFGFKNLPFELVVLDNADEETPIAMVGAKVCPILEKEDGSFMAESMDIVEYVDSLDGQPIFAPSSKRADISGWINDNAVLFRQLLYPRWVKAPLGEFENQVDRDYFTKKKEKDIGSFEQVLANSSGYIATLEAELEKLAPMLHSETSVNESLSLDDIDVFGRLRGITLIKGLTIPAKIRAYIDYFAQKSGVPTYDDIAI